MRDLPTSWGTAKLADLCRKIVDGSHNPPKATADGKPMLSARNIQQRGIRFDDYRLISDEAFDAEDRRTRVAVDDVLLTIVGTIGRVAVVQENTPAFALQRSVAVLKPDDAVIPTYLGYALESPRVQKHLIDNAKGTAQKGIYLGALGELELEVAPLNEQKRIADKLDVLLGRVDVCRDHLNRVPAILKRLRQAVLDAATSGRLTKDWREERSPSADWSLVRLADIGDLGRGKSKHRPRNDPRLYGGPYPFIQTGAIAQSGGRITHHEQTYSESGLAQSKLWPTGTVCITIAANIADTAVLTYPACFPDSVVGFVADSSKSVAEFVKWSVDVIRDRLESFAPATAQKNINLAVLNDVQLRCPPLEEQHEIVRRVEVLFTYADRLEARYAVASAQVEKLTSSLLAKAFRGKLVPQDPNDEPAGVLLDRIRAARAAAPATVKTRKPKTPKQPKPLKEKAAMRKSRFDDDVKDQPYLAKLLRTASSPLETEDLYRQSELPLVDFYKQLAWEVEQGMILDNTSKLEAA